jgi:hypothetical protein
MDFVQYAKLIQRERLRETGGGGERERGKERERERLTGTLCGIVFSNWGMFCDIT